MKRVFSLLMAVLLIGMLALPAYAEEDGSAAVSGPQATEEADGGADTDDSGYSTTPAYLVSATPTNTSGGEISTIKPGDHFTLVLQVVDYAAAAYEKDELAPSGKKIETCISARYNGSSFTYSGPGEVGKLQRETDNSGVYYYKYQLLFRNVVYNGGSSTFNIDLSYSNTTLAMTQLTVNIGKCVDTTDSTASGAKPNLIARSASYGTSIITAGSPFTLTVELFASGGTADLEDVIARVQLPQGVSLTGGSTSVYVGKMAPGSTRNVSFSILPSASFTGEGGNGVANISVQVESEGGASGDSIVVSVPIEQPDRFELGSLEIYDTLYVGEGGSVTLGFVNKGQNTVTNLEATISGTNFIAEDRYLYLGNVAPGTESSVDFDIYPEMAGPITGIITLTYEYADGTTKTLTQEFSATAEDYSMNWGGFEDPGFAEPFEPVEPESSGLPWWATALIVLAVVAVAVVVIVIVKKRRKAKAMAALGDEDEDF